MSIRRDFLFTELAEGAPIEILRPGEFLDMRGNGVEITEQDLDQFVAHFEEGAAGIEIPVDVDHKHEEAVGWVRRIWREGQRLLASVEWNEIGRQLVGDKVYRYISATINLEKRFVRAITLTNWPAVSGLAPVELSEGAGTYAIDEGLMGRLWWKFLDSLRSLGVTRFERDSTGTGGDGSDADLMDSAGPGPEKGTGMSKLDQLTPEERAEVEAQLRAELEAGTQQEAELRRALRDELRPQIEADLAAKIARRQELVEFAERVCGGEAGLSASPEDVVTLLAALDEEHLDLAKSILQSKVVDFGEHGSGRDGQAGVTAVPDEYRGSLRRWVEAGQPVAEYFELVAPELDSTKLDLSEYQQDK